MSDDLLPPKPRSRREGSRFWLHAWKFRRDIFAAQSAKLYHAWMAELRLPRFRSYLVNDPDVLTEILRARPKDFPKSKLVNLSLRSLLGESVFVTNGELWEFQRRIIDPAFEGGKLRDTFDAIDASARDVVERFSQRDLTAPIEIEEMMSHGAADIIFRTLFSIPITDAIATQTYQAFQAHQRSQPLMNFGAIFGFPRLVRRSQRRKTRQTAKVIRALLTKLVHARQDEIAKGTAPDDLASKIMTYKDPETGRGFTSEEMIDQVAIFFLAGHETSASAISWALYLLASHPSDQERLRAEIDRLFDAGELGFSKLSKLPKTRDVFRETLRLYPPVPMMVRETISPEKFRERDIPIGSQMVISPSHLHRHDRIWPEPDAFKPERWQDMSQKEAQRSAYMPFSTGPRVCPGAGFAMIEGVVLLAHLLRHFEIATSDQRPQPVAHLTLRAEDGIYLRFSAR